MSFVSVTTPESGIVRDGLLYWINPSLASSYSGSGTTIYDLSGNDYDSSLQSGAGFSADNGGVFSTNGSSSWIKLEDNFWGSTEQSAASHFTISMWFRTVEGSSGMLLSQTNNATIGSGTGWVPAIYIGTDGKLRVSCFWGGSQGNQTTVDIPDLRDNKWHNVVVTYAGTGADAHKTYVDGILKGSLTKTQASYSSNYYYYVGGGRATGWVGAMSGNFWFNGNFGDFKYYNRALTDIEVLQNFRAMAPRYGSEAFVPTDISGIVGWWDPSDSSTVTLSGSAVTAITNKVSGGISMVTYVSSPDIATANLNGKDVLDFTRTEGLHTNTSLTTSSDVTVIMVAQLEDPPSAGGSTTLISNSDSEPYYNPYRLACAYGGTSGAGNYQYIDFLSGTGQYHINGNTTAFVGGSVGPNNREDLRALIADGTGWNIIAIADLDFAGWNNDFRIMRYFEGSTSYSCEGLVADVIVYPSTLSTLDRQRVEGYVAHKYALQSKLPIGHPYKSTAP